MNWGDEGGDGNRDGATGVFIQPRESSFMLRTPEMNGSNISGDISGNGLSQSVGGHTPQEEALGYEIRFGLRV